MEIHDIEYIYYKFNLSLINLIGRHSLTKDILAHFISSDCNRHKYSIITDLTQIANILQCNLAIVVEKNKQLNGDLLNKMTNVEIDEKYQRHLN